MSVPLWRQQSDRVNSRLMERWLPTELGTVLKTDLYDEAVSAGLYPYLALHADRVTGVDLSPGVVSGAARRHAGLDAIAADVRALPFEPDSFDAIVSNSTLDHLRDESDAVVALAELARVLRPGGHLVITLDNPLNPAVALRNRLPARMARRLRRGFPYEPGWTCGPRRLRHLLASAGFDVRAEASILHGPRVMVALAAPSSDGAEARMLNLVLKAEALERLPSRYLSGHFIAAHATRPEGPPASSIGRS